MENPLIYTREADNSDSKGMGGLGHFKALPPHSEELSTKILEPVLPKI